MTILERALIALASAAPLWSDESAHRYAENLRKGTHNEPRQRSFALACRTRAIVAYDRALTRE